MPPSEGDESRATPEPAATSTRPGSGWTAGRVIGMVFASIGGLIGLALLLGGIAVIVAYAFERDSDGYFNSDRKPLDSATYAITTGKIDLGASELDWAPNSILPDVRLQVDSKKPVFVGIGPDAKVGRYLGNVSHDQLVDFNEDRPQFSLHDGRAPPTPPAKQDFWVARSQDAGEQAVTWDAVFGRWTAVVMNADASRGVNVDAEAGVKLDWAIWAGIGMFVVGLLITTGTALLMLRIGRRARRRAPIA
jgi:hypothetical protein